MPVCACTPAALLQTPHRPRRQILPYLAALLQSPACALAAAATSLRALAAALRGLGPAALARVKAAGSAPAAVAAATFLRAHAEPEPGDAASGPPMALRLGGCLRCARPWRVGGGR